MTLYAIRAHEILDIGIRPVENRQYDIYMIRFAAVNSTDDRLFIERSTFRAFASANALNGRVENLILF